jgi:LemA protein
VPAGKGCLTGTVIGGLVVLLLIVAVVWAVGTYNDMVGMREAVDAAWGQVEVQLQRRADLIPNLVESVKGYATHERELFAQIAEARGRMMGAGSPGEAARASGELSQLLGRLFAIAEAYPELKANENFLKLQDELAGTENRLSVERKRYNDAVRTFNTRVKQFPAAVIAGMFGFIEREYFEAPEVTDEVPIVDFGQRGE